MERPPDDPGDPRDDRGERGLQDDTEPEEEPRQADLLAIGLLVFFVSLIGVVGALLLLPVLV